jgi:hypothetical protein
LSATAPTPLPRDHLVDKLSNGKVMGSAVNRERDDMLFELERRLAQVGRRVSAEEAASLFADDFVEFGASGKIWSKAEIIAAMSQWAPIERTVENFRVRELSPSVCLVTYKVVGVTKDKQASPFSLRSSIWRYTGERWQIVFHQGTNVK